MGDMKGGGASLSTESSASKVHLIAYNMCLCTPVLYKDVSQYCKSSTQPSRRFNCVLLFRYDLYPFNKTRARVVKSIQVR